MLVEEAASSQVAVRGNPWCDKVKGDTIIVPADGAVSAPTAAANRAQAHTLRMVCLSQGYPSFTITRQQAVDACNKMKTLQEDRVFYHWGTWCVPLSAAVVIVIMIMMMCGSRSMSRACLLRLCRRNMGRWGLQGAASLPFSDPPVLTLRPGAAPDAHRLHQRGRDGVPLVAALGPGCGRRRL
jgi:hypothetical protein